jgi:hypothetical protein
MKVELPNNSHIKMPIYSCGNTEEYLTHIVAVLHIIKQKGLDAKCRKLGKAVVRQSEKLKNLLEATGPRDTVLIDVDIQAHKVEIRTSSTSVKPLLGPQFWSIYTHLALLEVRQNTN